jgi:hypothetical protein
MKDLPDDLTPAEARLAAANAWYWQARASGDESEIRQASIARSYCEWRAIDSNRLDYLMQKPENQEPWTENQP